ncbi:membrane protease YdiL (CAAX protease family) [Parvibaculum indicum]|uniref:CPBP family intramembrane glutamic endopeptidase n=1 Tax=Parvibaculum indicum TaxID=562969 RepID=UPI0014201C55|nr:CPBP family intramembrane glutamic endopeptidase [Parvibaculum indicum]NIJ40447.1 membrane protease YdiL (CAAX protease family) [Parvibaculum indicum]
MVWGPDSTRAAVPPAEAALPPDADGAPEGAEEGVHGFRLRDAFIIIAATLVGQFLGVIGYGAVLYLTGDGTVQDLLWKIQHDPFRNHMVVVSGFCGYLAMLLWIVHLLRGRRITPSGIGLVRAGGGWFALVLLLFFALKGLSVWLMTFLDEATIEASYRTMDGLVGKETLWAAGSALLVVAIAPFLEEVAFRGALYQGLSRHMPRLVAAGIATLGFAAIHLQYALAGGVVAVVTTAQVLLLGAALMFLYMKSRSLWPGIALHALNNGVSLIFLFAVAQP